METNVESLEGNKAKVTVTVDAVDIDGRINKTYKDFARKYNFPGFRRGKAPRPVIDNALGAEAVRATVTDEVLNSAWAVADAPPSFSSAEKISIPCYVMAASPNRIISLSHFFVLHFKSGL